MATDSLDGVVALDVDVTAGGDGQVETGMNTQCGQHVVEERNSRLDVAHTRAVKIDREFNA
mgnify:CR=1 FL=1